MALAVLAMAASAAVLGPGDAIEAPPPSPLPAPPTSPSPPSPPAPPPLAPFADEPCTDGTQEARCKVTLKIEARL